MIIDRERERESDYGGLTRFGLHHWSLCVFVLLSIWVSFEMHIGYGLSLVAFVDKHNW